jgi:hypothetical protein
MKKFLLNLLFPELRDYVIYKARFGDAAAHDLVELYGLEKELNKP